MDRVTGPAAPTSSGMSLAEFNSADPAKAAEVLGACLDIDQWVAAVVSGRPYRDVESLQAAGTVASAGISWAQVAGALARHPRIGEKSAAVVGTGTESAWSASEQAGVQAAAVNSLAQGNRDYEQRFGHIFLICAAGLSGEQILADLTCRLANDPEVERPVVIAELRKIAALRLAKAVVGS